MDVMDIFRQDPFSVISMTAAINHQPFVPGRAGMLIPWMEEPVATTTIMIEEIEGQLKLVNPTPRGGPGETALAAPTLDALRQCGIGEDRIVDLVGRCDLLTLAAAMRRWLSLGSALS